MSTKFPEYKDLNLSKINKEILKKWQEENAFEKSLSSRNSGKNFVFFEGPPSANGKPGIHHVMARTIKDVVCRYKTLDGYRVDRKAGWDTHGLPVELAVEKMEGITKEDIGKKISIEEYNNKCRQEVMKYTKEWEDLTDKMGYWINMEDPYITYDNRYIETLWWLLKQFFEKDLLYKGYTIQPYSPAAGTGLSTHELNQPGCYRDVTDTTAVAQFKVIRNQKSDFLFKDVDTDLFFLAWTTTPWTLPSNTALAVGKDIKYVKIRSFNPYTSKPITVILAKDLQASFFPEKNAGLSLEDYKEKDKNIPFQVIGEYKGSDLKDIQYEQLLNWINPGEGAFRVVVGDFVTTEDGTGIVHIAPTFGADDYRVANQNDIPALLVVDTEGKKQPLVDKKGRFYAIDDLDKKFVTDFVNPDTYKEFSGRFVKNEYDESIEADATSTDIDIAVYLKLNNQAFRIEKYVHNYPHCWRTDKPILYYPLDSWFIRTTAMKDKMIELNKTINWKPESTGTGRFGKWLENLVDWNLSRSRYWGTPLPIWVSEDKKEIKCIGSVEELKSETEKSVQAGFMSENPFANYVAGVNTKENYDSFDLHRPFVDNIILVSENGKKLYREPDLIDVWFDSGAMPYAQWHYPFENKEGFDKLFPAEFIAEGVDQTRGWFFTLHAIATMLFDKVSFKNIISNGLVLDKNGNKMSKRLGNAIDPFTTIEEHGTDPLRWYLVTNAQPWDNLKFDLSGIDEVKRKFFGTLYNTYSFFTLYANIDGFTYKDKEIPVKDRPEIDRWIISLLNSLIKEVKENYDNYEITRAGRLIQDFVTENLSNWYVRLNRKRFWGGKYDEDKISAYQTLYYCLETVAILSSPIAPFYSDRLFCDLNLATNRHTEGSVHLASFPSYSDESIDKNLEERMQIAQTASSMVLGLRRKVNIKVRQPLQKMMIPIPEPGFEKKFDAVKNLILSEVNVKEVEYIAEDAGVLVKKVKPDFKSLGPKYGKLMKEIAVAITKMSQEEILEFERNQEMKLHLNSEDILIDISDVEIISEDIPGWLVANEGKLTIALDITINENLRNEGVAREFVNRIQNLRKESNFDVTDKIRVSIQKNDAINNAISIHKDYIATQTLAASIELYDNLGPESKELEIDDEIKTQIKIIRVS
ncbi:MAG: isoleucine--tRNA ligase [Bacteroidales bacterium]|nr:isoleucine--tRNA ligase [Bacteroidales bacterium]MCF8389121.1 isoleucine--tRNA ligase [Bacteroidales bacterium]